MEKLALLDLHQRGEEDQQNYSPRRTTTETTPTTLKNFEISFQKPPSTIQQMPYKLFSSTAAQNISALLRGD
ncbi:hypothetical protein N9Q98_01095 [bacterium]|nr:hypothetical protein [bacterium]